MAIGTILTAFILGLVATGSCLTICMPFFLPFVIANDNNWKKGLLTSLTFSAGRLIVYMVIGFVFYLLFSNLLETVNEGTHLESFNLLNIVIGWIIIIYAVYMISKLPFPKVCPAKYARGGVSLMVGMLIGSFVCPPFLIMLSSTLDESIPTLVGSVFLFWLASSISIILLGTGAGWVSKYIYKKIDPEKIKNIMYMVLIMVGFVFFLVSGYSNIS